MSSIGIPSPAAPSLRFNIRHLYWDILWFGVLSGSTIAFLAIYAARLDASSLEIGLLSAGPAMVNLLFTLPSGRWLEGRPLGRTSFVSSVWQRLGYVALIALPWLLIQRAQVWGLIWIVLVMSVPGTVLAISFISLFAEVVPPEWRARVVGRRNALSAISMTVTTLICGLILDKIAFPINYQIVFLIGAVGALMSSYHVGKIRPEHEAVHHRTGDVLVRERGVMESLKSAFRSNGKPLLRLDVLRGPFGLFMLAYLVFYISQYYAIPLFPLAYVNELKLTDGMISIGGAMFYATLMVASLGLDRFSARFGHRKVLLFGVFLFPQYPLLLGLGHGTGAFYAASIIGGVIFAYLNGGLVNRLMERVPGNDRPAHMAIHNLALNLGILAGSLLGPVFSDWIGLRQALLLGAGLRLGSAVLIYFLG